jgi:hypothetical protein
MSVKEKWLLVGGAAVAILGGYAGHHFWACAIDVLRHLVAAGFMHL